eukprot:2506831-Amphidinium_carterae.1
MTNLSSQARIAFVSFPHTSTQTGVAKVIAELYDAFLESHARGPIKLMVMGEDNVTAMLRVKVHAVVELDGASCTDYQGRKCGALSLRFLAEGEVRLPEPTQIESRTMARLTSRNQIFNKSRNPKGEVAFPCT